ncbi:glycosyltransferase family 4 protein [candidate division WOR-3 bacterium]|nr:glycosyltransferase family 4 protein [candidate division WOR-3 bacterium]
MRVLFLTLFTEIGASSRYRVYQLMPHLEKKGISCTTSPLLSEKFYKVSFGFVKYPKPFYSLYIASYFLFSFFKRVTDVIRAKNYDIVFIQKDILPLCLLGVLKLLNKNIIFEFDDAIFMPHPSHKGSLGKILEVRRKHFSRIICMSKHIIVSNNYNKAPALQYNPNVSVIRGPIDTDRFFVKKENEKDKIVIGWIGHPTATPFIQEMQGIFDKIGKKFPNVILSLVGSKKIAFSNIKVMCKNWTLDTEVEDLQSFDIGIGPLPDVEWHKGKGGVKLLQYMSCGIPVVASPVGINSEIVVDGVTGFLATTEEEWYEKLSILIKDKKLREKMGMEGRKRVEERYSLKKAVPKLINIFQGVISNARVKN